MKYGVVMSSEVAKQGRWDAGFHLLNQEYAEQAEILSVTMSEDEAVALLTDEQAVPTHVLRVIAPLVRGTVEQPSRQQLIKAVEAYPFLSLAIIKDKGIGFLEAEKDKLTEQVQKMNQVKQVLETAGPTINGLTPISHDVRGLLNKNRFVANVVYFDGDTLAIPVDTLLLAHVADCWVIELSDWTGPEMIDELVSEGNVPVPRRHKDLGKPVGCVGQLADHTQNYGMGWRR